MRASFTTAEILAATGGTLVHQGAWDTFCGVSTDSRTSQTGELFIPLTGEKHDGHEFIPAALRRGVRGVLVEKRILRATGAGAGLKPAPTVPAEFPPGNNRHRHPRRPDGPGRSGPGLAGAVCACR